MHRARLVFVEWQQILEEDEELFGARLMLPRGAGMIWRNKAARDYYELRGFLATPTTPWSGVKAWMTRKELLAMDWVVRRVFITNRPVIHEIEAQADGHEPVRTLVTYRSVHGCYDCGVIITLLQPFGL